MADTTLRDCKVCGEEFDSIYQFDKGICDDCQAIGAIEILEMSNMEFQDMIKEKKID